MVGVVLNENDWLFEVWLDYVCFWIPVILQYRRSHLTDWIAVGKRNVVIIMELTGNVDKFVE